MNGHLTFRRFAIVAVAIAGLTLSSHSSAFWPTFNMSLQEYIVVVVKDAPQTRAAVVINGETNGVTGELLTLGSPGWVVVSVRLPNAHERNVNVKNTTPSHPMTVEIECK